MLKFELNVEERKTLAKRMEELTGIHPYYTKAPRYAYDIGNYTIDRDGNLLVEAENADLELLTTLMNEGLIRGGEDVDAETLQETADEQPAIDLAEGVQMIPAVHPNGQETCEGDSEEAEEDGESEMESAEQIPSEEGGEQPVAEEAIPLDADFSFPISQHNGVSLRNLVNLIYSRGELISKATDGIFLADKGLVDALKDDSCTYAVANFIHAVKEYEEQHGASLEGLTITDEKVTFTGFPTAPDYDHLTAFGHLAILMNQQAVSQKRIQAKEVNDSNEKWLYANVSDIKNLVGDELVASAIKSAMAELAPNEVTNRTKIEPLAQQKLAESLVQKYGEDVVFVNKVVINDMNFEDAYNEAIQQKSIAQQNADKQKIENEAAIAKAEADKQVAITNAEAEAQKTSIAAEAQAEANRKLAESLSDTLIEYQKIQKWDGKLPTVSGSNALVSIDPAE